MARKLSDIVLTKLKAAPFTMFNMVSGTQDNPSSVGALTSLVSGTGTAEQGVGDHVPPPPISLKL